MKKLNYLLLAAFILIFSTSVNAQTVDEIIENYIENTGGAENWQNVKAIKMSASINQMGMEIPIEMIQSENKMYTKISIQGQEIKQGVFDGETLWSTNFMSMKAEKSDQEDIDNVKNELGEFPDPFLNYKEKGFSVVRDFCGHGISTTFHEQPNILHYGTKNTGMELTPGMTFTIEPMINAGKYDVKMLNDGWTAVSKDKSLSAQFEHTIGITENGYEIFTESAKGYSKPPYL